MEPRRTLIWPCSSPTLTGDDVIDSGGGAITSVRQPRGRPGLASLGEVRTCQGSGGVQGQAVMRPAGLSFPLLRDARDGGWAGEGGRELRQWLLPTPQGATNERQDSAPSSLDSGGRESETIAPPNQPSVPLILAGGEL